jgi:hypothetical protein
VVEGPLNGRRALSLGAGARLRPRVCQAAAAPGAHRQRVCPVSPCGIAMHARGQPRNNPKANTVLSTSAGCATPHRRHRRLRPQRSGRGANGAAPRHHFGLCGPRDVPAKLAPLRRCMDACRISARPVHNCARAPARPCRSLQLTGVCMCVLLLAQLFVRCRDCVAKQLWIAEGNHPDGHQARRISWVRPTSTLVSLSSAPRQDWRRPDCVLLCSTCAVYVKIACANCKRACCASTERCR